MDRRIRWHARQTRDAEQPRWAQDDEAGSEALLEMRTLFQDEVADCPQNQSAERTITLSADPLLPWSAGRYGIRALRPCAEPQ